MSKRLPPYIGLAVLFVVSFLALHWVYGYVVVIQSETNDGFFMFGRHFLVEFLDHPGDLLRYAGRFLSQFYHYPWLGALIVSTCIAFFGLLFHRVLVNLRGKSHVSQVLLPCLFLLGLHTSTIYMIYDTVGLCTSCVAFWGYVSLRGKAVRGAYALVATPALYLLLGAYVVVCGLDRDRVVVWRTAPLHPHNASRDDARDGRKDAENRHGTGAHVQTACLRLVASRRSAYCGHMQQVLRPPPVYLSAVLLRGA